MEKRTTEKIIVFAYSAYSMALMITAMILNWASWTIPTLLVLVFISWFVYSKETKDYRFRAFLYAGLALLTFSVYGVMTKSFEAILPMFCAVVILLGLFGIPEILWEEIVFSIILVLYHFCFLDTIPFETGMDKYHFCVQMASVAVV